MRVLWSALLLASLAPAAPQRDAPPPAAAPGDPARQFDFWVGEWDVHNRMLRSDGGWRDAGAARARIRPILGGNAILEEWDGRSGDRRGTFGISIRAYDPAKQRWVIALNWPSPSSARFSHMEGSFRHRRGEFFPPPAFDAARGAAPRGVRFTFSDALADTCRWDMAQPVEGAAWRTTWIMEFTRRRAAAETIADGEPVRRAPADPVCSDPAARQLDALHGVWRGDGWRRAAGGREEVSAELRATSSNRGCATLCFLAVKAGDAEPRRCFEAWAYYADAGKWVARTIDDTAPRLFTMVGEFDAASGGSFVRTDSSGDPLERTRRVRYFEIGDDRMRCAHDVSTDSGETWEPALELSLKRVE